MGKHPGQVRGNALWGSGNRSGDTRRNALWGRGGKSRGALIACLLILGLALPALATADPGKGRKKQPRERRDTTSPETSITQGPGQNDTVVGSVRFTFGANESASFQCSVDGRPFVPCSGPTQTIPQLGTGQHTFAVRAVDPAGNIDPTPESVKYFEAYANDKVYPAGTLLARAKAAPTTIFAVIVELPGSAGAENAASRTQDTATGEKGGGKGRVGRGFVAINGFPAKLPGWALLWFADKYPRAAITEDKAVRDPLAPASYEPRQVWQAAIGADQLWQSVPQGPAIAVIDSGIDAGRAGDFGARVIARVNFDENAVALDDYGHGTFVAGVAAGGATAYPGVAPRSNLVDVRVIGANGSANTSDVIEGIDWVLRHKDQYGIKVVNLSLRSAKPNSFRFDPLDHAVEQLWLNGVTVVTSSGNSGTGKRQPMNLAPANDPFVLTVGAADVNGTAPTADDSVAEWSSFGYTADGFLEPTLVAPGRRLIGPAPATSTLATTRPGDVVAAGYMQLSGTSFAAAAVSGAAAQLSALHPSWGPDQIKGALMLTASQVKTVDPAQDGVGEINIASAAGLASPPNPNAALNRFLVADVAAPGGRAFDSASWVEAAKADRNWYAGTFANASWAEASWADASWAEASWAEIWCASASWADAAAADAALPDGD